MTKAEAVLAAIEEGATDEMLMELEAKPESEFTNGEVGKTNGDANQGVDATSKSATPESTELESEDTSLDSQELDVKLKELDKKNDMLFYPNRYDETGNLKPEFETYTDSKGISHSKKARKKADTSIGEKDYIFRIDKTKDKVGQVVDMYNNINEDNEEVRDLLKNTPNANTQNAIEEIQKQKYKNITENMNQEELDDMHVMLEKKYGLNITTTGVFSLPEVVVKEDFITTEATKIDIKREKEVRRLLANIDLNNKEVKEEIAKQYFDFSGIPFRNTGKPEDIIYDERLFAKTVPLEKQQQLRRWEETGELPMYSTLDGVGINQDVVNRAIELVKDRTIQTYNERLSDKERFDYMKHMPTATPGTTAFIDYYKQRRKDEIDFKAKYGYTLTHKRKGNKYDDRVYVPVNDYGADWAKHFSKAVNQSSSDYIKNTSDRIIKDDKDLTVEIEKFNALNSDLMARSKKLNRELEDMGSVTSDSPRDVIANYNAIIGELRVLKQSIVDRGLGDIHADISRRSEKLKAEIDNLGDVAEVNQDLSIIAYASGLNYNNIDRTIASIEKGLINPVSVAGSDLIDFFLERKDGTWDLGSKARQRSIKTDEEFEETFSKNLSFSWQNLDIWLPQALANNSSSLAAVGGFFVNPLLGYSLFGGMGYGHKVTDIERSRQTADKQIEVIDLKLEKAITNDEKLALQKQKDDWQRKKDISFWQERTSGIVSAGAEIIWERLGSVNAIKNFQKWSRVVGKGTFKRTMGIGYGLGLTQAIEIGEELGTEFTNNISDIINLKENKSIGDGINKDFFANVSVTGLALQGPNMGQTTWNLLSDQVRTRDQKRINKERLQKIEEIDKRLQNPLSLNSIEVEKLEKDKMDLIEEAGIETVMNIDNLNDLTFEEKQAVFEKARQAQETLAELEALGATGDLTSNYAIKNKKFLMDKYNELVGEKDQLLDKGGKEIRERAKNSNSPAAAAYNAGVNKFVTNLARYNTTKNGKQFTQIKDISDLKQNEEIFDDYQEILEAYEAGDYAFHTENGDVYVFQENIDNQIYGTVSTNIITGEQVYSDNNTLEAMVAAVAPFHENLHNRNRAVGIIKNKTVVESAVEAIEGIEAEMQALLDARKITQEVFDLFQARKKVYTDKNTGVVNMEELINIVGDLTFIGAIPPSGFNNLYGFKSLLNNVSSYFNKETAPMVRFKTGRDVFNYVQSFHKQSKARKVKLTSRTTDDKKAISLSKSTYDQFNPEELVQIIKAPSSTAVQIAAANESLAKQFDLLAIKALNYDPKTGDIARENVISAAREYLPGIINRFDPETAKFSTFVTSNIAPKQPTIYEEAKSLSFETVSLDAPQAQQIADETTDLDNTLEDTKKPKIDVLKINKVVGKEKDIRKTTKIKKGDTHKEVTDNNTGAVGEVIFEVPSEKIANPKKNLTYSDEILDVETGKAIPKEELKKGKKGIPGPSESKSIQNVFADFDTSRDFIRILPETNVSEQDADINKVGENIQVSRDVYGRAIGLPNRVLEYFYDPVFKPDGKRLRSQGKTSQVGIWKLKSKFKNPSDKVVTQFQRDLGITERQEVNELPKGDKRSAIGQLLKGAAKTFSQQVSLSVAQRKLAGFPQLVRPGAKKAKAQEIADVTAGQSKLAFSKATQSQDIDNNILNEGIVEQEFEMDDVTHVDKLLAREGQKSIFRHRTEDEMNDWFYAFENDIIANVPESVLPKSRLNSILRPSRRIFAGKRFGLEGKGKDIITIKKGKHKGKKMSISDYYDILRKELLAKDLKYGEKFEGEGAKYVYGPTYADKFGKTESQIKKSFDDGTVDAQNKINLSMHVQLWERINQSIKDTDGKSLRAWGSWLSMVGQDTEHPHRMGAELVGYSKNPKGVKNKKGKVKLYEWEHAMPATRAYLYLLNAAVKKELDFETSYGLVSNNFKLIALDSFEDLKLKAAGRTTSMGKGWSIITDSWLDRYFKGDVGIDANSIIGFNNKTFKDIYGIPTLKLNINKAKKLDKAIMFSRSINPPKGITVLDFDDTLATTKSLVKYTRPDGTTGTLNAEEYANTYEDLLDQGFTFDFSDFNKVVKGKIAPLFQKALKLQGKFGPENMFVLTARPPQAAKAIFDFLKANGLNIPIKNITGLANSTSEAKALWIAERVGEGYNDFYFADDALQNVQAVKNMLDQFDVKSKVQQAKIQFSKNASNQFNNILESSTGVESQKQFSNAQARLRGQKTKYKSIIPASAQDFQGLLYNFLGKGRQGEADMAFFKKTLIDPFSRGINELNSSRQAAANDFKNLNKQHPKTKKLLNQKIEGLDYTYDQAARVYLWNKAGFDIPGLSKRDLKALTGVVAKKPELQAYADAIGLISKKDNGYSQPKDYWLAESIASDLLSDGAIGDKRSDFLAEWIENKNMIFSSENLNKIEAIYGSKFREALEDILYRMENGTNRPSGRSRLVNSFMNWTNNSVGAIMFFNMRSATLQTISAANYVNWSDNNPAKAAAAFANQPQFWRDFVYIFNSDYLKQRRTGNQRGVNEAELSEAVAGSDNKAKTVIAFLLKKGFTPTQIADSFAISMGGSTFYRNRIKKYVKDGMSQKEAETKAWLDFQEITEVNQQSARPDMISQQQASPLGRLILAFQNTPMQYARIMNKATRDLVNGRGDYKTHISKIAYYGVVQSIIFGALQSALYASLGEDEEEEFDKKKERILNQMVDSWLTGIGYGGKAIGTVKNTMMEYFKQRDKGFNADHAQTLLTLLSFSPPIGSKLRKVYSSIRTEEFNRGIFGKRGFSLDNPIWAGVGNVVEGVTNIPLGRMSNLMLQLDNAMDPAHKWWQRVALLLGQNTWDLGIKDPDIEAAKLEIKEERKLEKEKERLRKKAEKEEKEKQKEEVKIEENKKKSKKDNICSAVGKEGKRCGNKVVSGKLFCTVHEKAEQRADGKETRCKKIKKDGKRCGMQTSNKSGYCYYHD